jgi:hypothetical protein
MRGKRPVKTAPAFKISARAVIVNPGRAVSKCVQALHRHCWATRKGCPREEFSFLSQTVDVLTLSTLRAKKILPTAKAPGRRRAGHR